MFIFKLLNKFCFHCMVWFSQKGQKGELQVTHQMEMFDKSALHLQCAFSSFDVIFKGNAPILSK